MDYLFGNKHQAQRILGGSTETLKKYRQRGQLKENIHWIRVNPRVVRYNLTLLSDWMQNINDPLAHQRAVEIYLASLPSNQPKKRGRRAGS